MLSTILRGGNAPWLLFIAFWMVLGLLAVVETWRPLHNNVEEPAGRIGVNVTFGVINAALAAIVPVSTVLPAQWSSAHGIGLMNRIVLPGLLAVVVTVLVRSLATYVLHRLSHAVPLLWRVHRIHHTDTRMDLSTGFRNHPLELAIAASFYAAVTVAFGLDPAALAAYEAVAILFTLWDHANVQVPKAADGLLRRLVVTPAMHHLHHSSLRRHTDSNYGEVLTVWDRLFGTYHEVPEEVLKATRFGLGDPFDAGAANLLYQLRAPFAHEATPPRAASEA